jgi:nitronate monooxygenase
MTAGPTPAGATNSPQSVFARARVPVVVAPMLLVSGPELVIAACKAGVPAAFPTANPREPGELERWLSRIMEECGQDAAPYIPNLIVHRSNPRLEEDLKVILKFRPAAVICSVGSPERVSPALKDAGVQVWSDVASVRHADRAIAAGVDGLILLTAGAGGQTGTANAFAFTTAVRRRFDGLVAVAGGQATGRAILAAQVLGCDFAYMGTRFIATREANAAPGYKQFIVDSELDDIHLTDAFSGLQTNMLRKSMVASGLDPGEFGLGKAGKFGMEILGRGSGDSPKRWRDIWSAGHSVSGVRSVPTVAELVDQLAREYALARQETLAQLKASPGDR